MPLRRPRLILAGALVAAAAVAATGCGALYAVGIRLVYDEAALPAANVRAGLAYVEGSPDPKHRLNLFLPLADSVRAGPWPVVVFVHGGGWTTGDRDFRFGGEDLYNNVGRYLAQRGIGAAVVSYRLLPDVRWPAQVEDVARAAAWVRGHVAAYGGDPDALFLMGHSAGAQLATRVALDADAQAAAGLPPGAVCGAIPVSGAALDLTDRETFALEDDFDYYSARFSDDGVARAEPPAEPAAWQVAASPLRLVRPGAPPFLILYAGGETGALQRQSRLLDGALRGAGVESRVVVVPGQSHTRIVPTLSRDDRTAGPAVVAFVRAQRCV